MPGNYYIHNVYKRDVTSAFGEQKIQQQLMYQQSQLTQLNTMIAKQYESTIGSVSDYKVKTELLEKNLPKIMQELVAKLPTINWNAIRQALTLNDVSLLEVQINKIRADIEQYTILYNEIIELGAQNIPNKPVWLSEKALSRLTVQHNRMLEASKQLDTLLSDPDNRWKISHYISRVLSISAGFISEYGSTYLLDKYLGPLGIHFEQAGTKGIQGGYKTATEDISIQIGNTNGTINIKMPGISLKRTSTGSIKNPTVNIHLKSTSIGNLITFGKMVDMGFDLDTFYNAYANHNRQTINLKTGKTIVNKVSGLRQMYKAFYLAALNTALAGSMLSGDYAYYLIINEHVFTVIDVIQSVLSGNASILGGQGISLKNIASIDDLLNKNQNQTTLQAAQSLIAKYHQDIFYSKYLNNEIDDDNEAWSRSADVISKIDAITLILNLKMQLGQLI